jgi:hypothetical protein
MPYTTLVIHDGCPERRALREAAAGMEMVDAPRPVAV